MNINNNSNICNNTNFINKNSLYSSNEYSNNFINNYFYSFPSINQNSISESSLVNTYSSKSLYSFSKINFVYKLYHMLSCLNFSNYIKWDNSGLSFTIHDVSGFTDNVLKIYFRHNKFLSFIRSLNLYGFQKVINFSNNAKRKNQNIYLSLFKNKKGNWKFFHPKFIKGKPYLLKEISRKNSGVINNRFTENSNIINCQNNNIDKIYNIKSFNNNDLHFNYYNMTNSIFNEANNQNDNYYLINSNNFINNNRNILIYDKQLNNNYSQMNNTILYQNRNDNFNNPYIFEITTQTHSQLSNTNELNKIQGQYIKINSYNIQENEEVIEKSSNISINNQRQNIIQNNFTLFSQTNNISNNYFNKQNNSTNNCNIYKYSINY